MVCKTGFVAAKVEPIFERIKYFSKNLILSCPLNSHSQQKKGAPERDAQTLKPEQFQFSILNNSRRALPFPIINRQQVHTVRETTDIQKRRLVGCSLFQQYPPVRIADGDHILALRFKLEEQFAVGGVGVDGYILPLTGAPLSVHP